VIVGMVIGLLKDEFSEVKFNLFKNLDDICKVVDMDLITFAFTEALIISASDKNWRTRSTAVEYLPIFTKRFGEDYFNDKFSKILLECLVDKIYGVREAAVKCVKQLSEHFGSAWSEKHVLPKILTLKDNPNYLHRMTPLFTVM